MNIWHIRRALNAFNREREIGEFVGEYKIILPEQPPYEQIANWDLVKTEQKFKYTVQPKKNEQPTQEFLRQEIKRFQEGYWFFNNGNVEWLTPFHYFFLNYWKDKGKRMVFIDAQRDAAYWWWWIENQKNFAGGNIVSNRRFGKTVFGTAILYFRTTTASNRVGSLQSKTEPDGKKVFKKLISSWSKLPDWLKPVDTGQTRPTSIIEFFEPSTKSSKKEAKVYGEALDSWIYYESSTEEALDGEEIHTYYEDEVGKTKVVNTDTRWGVVKYTLLKGATIIGKALRTTTVEEMEKKGGKNFEKTWKASSMKTLNEKTGRTDSMLTNLFIPSDYGFYSNHPITDEPFVDEYGYSKRELAKAYILDTWANLEGDDLRAEQRKNPLVLKHAFQSAGGDSEFDNTLLDMQEDYLENEAPANLMRRVDFYLDVDGIVKWRDNPRGYFEFVWDFAERNQTNKRNRHINNLWAPGNADEFAIGVDPFAATITTGKDKSMAVAYVYRKGNPNDPENSGLVICRYAQRTKLKADFHKNVMLLCQYYGCKANYESDVDDYYETFLQQGFKNYIMWRPKNTIDPQRKNITVKYGTPSKDPYALQKHTQAIHNYIKTRWHKIYWLELIKQLKDYTTDDRTKFDDVIAFGMSLLAGEDMPAGTNPDDNKPVKFLQLKKKTNLPFRKFT